MHSTVRIKQYGLPWTVDMLVPWDLVLKQYGILTFLGKLSVHLFWGPYIVVNKVRAFEIENNTHEEKEYYLLNEQWFFCS